MRRLVEAELLLQALDEFRIEALRAAVFRGAAIELRAALLPARAEIAALRPPGTREPAPVSAPDSTASTRSTGPPGANCTTTNVTSIIPKMVGMMSKRRRMM